MKTIADRVKAFAELGSALHAISEAEKAALFHRAALENAWFTPENCEVAWQGILKFLDEKALQHWTSKYRLAPSKPRRVGLVLAGNIPMVGFHDVLSVIISGHQAVLKLSSQDTVLLRYIFKTLTQLHPASAELVVEAERLNGVDAIIATGSDNTARYFEYYFRNIPHIIRKNRSSCAVIMGEEATEEWPRLGVDVFSFFGLGCRNVSKLFVPENFELSTLLDHWSTFQPIIHHHKYVNNYDYQKSILLINQTPFHDTGFVLLTPSTNLVSPISVVYYETYTTQEDLTQRLHEQREKLQCIVSAKGWLPGSIPFGDAQRPAIDDYADDIDTLAFLDKLGAN